MPGDFVESLLARAESGAAREERKMRDSVNKVNQTAAKARKSALFHAARERRSARSSLLGEVFSLFGAVAARFALSGLRSPPVRLPHEGGQPKWRC